MITAATQAGMDAVLDQIAHAATPLLHAANIDAVQILWARHPDGPFHFALVYVPDGPCLGMSPLDAASDLFMRAQVPGGVSDEQAWAMQWAERQRWRVLVSKTYERHEVLILQEVSDADHDD